MSAQVLRVMLFVLVIAAAIAFPAVAFPAVALAADPPAPMPIEQGWGYAPDPGGQGLSLNWQSGRAGSDWRPTTVPHVFDANPAPQLFDGTVGWYRTSFVGPATAQGAGWWLRFEQIRRTAAGVA